MKAGSLEGAEKEPAFIYLLFQAKFFNCELEYTDEELMALKAWFDLEGIETLQTLFKKILFHRETSQAQFASSSLAQLFQDEATAAR